MTHYKLSGVGLFTCLRLVKRVDLFRFALSIYNQLNRSLTILGCKNQIKLLSFSVADFDINNKYDIGKIDASAG